jgi:calcineurin-like phosphoesterase family protein
MSRNIWVTSDQHWSHANILKFTDDEGDRIRPEFSSVEEMDEVMIDRWNTNVTKQDIIYHCGDIYFDHVKFTTKILPRLNGHIRIIPGNHDDFRKICNIRRFEKVLYWRRFPEFGLLLSHSPRDKESLFNWRSGEYLKNIHGHSHQRDHKDTETYKNICVERTNYYPVNIEELRVK